MVNKNTKQYKINYNDNYTKLIISNLQNNYKEEILLSSTGNCQLLVLGNINNVLYSHYSQEDDFQDDVIKKIKEYDIPQILIDVQEDDYDDIICLFKKHSPNFQILCETHYENSTGSPMVLCMFKWDGNYLDPDHPDYEYY